MFESTESAALGRQDARPVGSPVDVVFAELLDGLFASPRVTYAPVGEPAVCYGGHGLPRRHRRFVLRAGTDLDDPGW